jgi:RNA-directed DNA polymerase
VNEEKSAVDRPWRRKFLGFSFTFHKDPKIRIAKESIRAAKQKIRELTSRSKSMSMGDRIRKLNEFLVGWCNYFSLAETPSPFRELDGWIRRRLRMCLWKQWKKPKTKVRRLLALGIPKGKAFEWGNTRKKYWRIAGSPILTKTLNNSYWKNEGLKSMGERYLLCRLT